MNSQIQLLQQFGQETVGLSAAVAKPQVILPGGSQGIRDTARVLYSIIATHKALFFHAGNIVKLEQMDDPFLPTLKILKPAEARSEFEKFAQFVIRRREGNLEPAVISEDAARALLASDVGKEILPNVKGLINCPLPILHQGQFHILQPGYDVRTGFFVSGQALVEPGTLEEAVGVVETVLADFDFQSDGDISRAIAAILTPALKFGGFIRGSTPLEIVEALSPQTGKGFFVLRRAAVYGEIPIMTSQQKGGVGSFDEKFASALVKGRPFIAFDNLRGELDSQNIESFMTSQGNFSVRTPGCPEAYVDAANYCLSVTSNGMRTTDDLAKRSVFIRLQKDESGDITEIGGHRVLEAIRTIQPRFLGAVCRIIRHWHAKGMPKTNDRRHSFSGWAQPLDWIVQNVFRKAPLLDGNTEAQERLQNPDLTFLRLVAIEVENDGDLGKEISATGIVEVCEAGDIAIPGMNTERTYKEEYPPKAVGKVMRRCFDKKTELGIEGFLVRRVEVEKESPGFNREILKCYIFTKPAKDTTDSPDPKSAAQPTLADTGGETSVEEPPIPALTAASKGEAMQAIKAIEAKV